MYTTAQPAKIPKRKPYITIRLYRGMSYYDGTECIDIDVVKGNHGSYSSLTGSVKNKANVISAIKQIKQMLKEDFEWISK
jgi:metal-responsive CopG/Arc/MetJ family transcriptional regulator